MKAHFVRASSPIVRRSAPIPSICAGSELRLIIITNDEEVVLGCREELDEPQLRGVDVLELVDAHAAEASLSAAAELRIGLERRRCGDHQVVEVR
jgi:hypothetical protein